MSWPANGQALGTSAPYLVGEQVLVCTTAEQASFVVDPGAPPLVQLDIVWGAKKDSTTAELSR